MSGHYKIVSVNHDQSLYFITITARNDNQFVFSDMFSPRTPPADVFTTTMGSRYAAIFSSNGRGRGGGGGGGEPSFTGPCPMEGARPLRHAGAQ